MADGARVGSAHIEIIPELDQQAVKRTQRELKKHLKEMAKAADKEHSRQQKEIIGDSFHKGMRALQKGETQKVFQRHRAEIQSYQKLQKQMNSAMAAQEAQAAKAFAADKKRIGESIAAGKSLAAQRERAISSIQKAERQAYAEDAQRRKAYEADQAKRLADLDRWYRDKQRLEKADAAEGKKAADDYIADQNRRMKAMQLAALGVGPEVAGASKPTAALRTMRAEASKTANAMQRGFGEASRVAAQLSTRIGLASFQLQLLGGFATTFLTGPAVFGMAAIAQDGLRFAVNIDYARASMKALLGPAADVETILREIKEMAIESPLFAMDDAITFAQQLAAIGVQEKDLSRTMQALSNIFLTQGVAGPERAHLAMLAYTQILSKGAIGMDDLRQQFAEHVPGGIEIFAKVARRLGYEDLEDLREAFKGGEISAEELNRAFIDLGNSATFLTGAANAASTLGGVWQSFTEEMQSEIGMAFDRNRDQIIGAINAIRPVAMSFVNWMVKNIPVFLKWVNQLALRIQSLKAAYDQLNPEAQSMLKWMVAITLATGPASIAIGIFGTAISGAVNGVSFLAKGLSLVGVSAGGVVAVVIAVGVALAGLTTWAYNADEAFRLGFLRSLNLMKDYIGKWILPTIDLFVWSLRGLLGQLESLGFKTEWFAYLFVLLAIPMAQIIILFGALTLAIEVVKIAFLTVLTVLNAVLQTLSVMASAVELVARLFALLPGSVGKFAEDGANAVAKMRSTLEGLIPIGTVIEKMWSGGDSATKDFQSALEGLDFTTTGVTGIFKNFNLELDRTIDKQMTLEDAITNARRAMDAQGSAARSTMDASDSYKKSVLALTNSIKANGKTLDADTQAGQANRDMMKLATQASYEMMLQDIRSGVPMEKAIKRHKNRTEALKDEFGQNKATRTEAQKLIDTYGKVPPDVRTLLQTMGYKDVEKRLLDLLAMQWAGKNGTTVREERAKIKRLDGIGAFASGGYTGVVKGIGGPTEDRNLIRVSRREYVVNAKATDGVGVGTLNYINQHGELPPWSHPQFAKGGYTGWPFPINVKRFQTPAEMGGGPNTGGMGWQRMMQILRAQFPGLPLYSGFRPGAITSTGNRSYHSMGRAVDIPPRWDVFNWIRQQWGKGTKELIFTPAGNRQIKNGRDHVYNGGTIRRDHYDHVHWAYDNGGMVPPGVPFINKTNSHELMLNNAQAAALEDRIRNSDRPIHIEVYVDGVRRDAEAVVDEKFDDIVRALGGV